MRRVLKVRNSPCDLRDQLSVDIRQPHVAAVEQVRQSGVIDPKEVQYRGVKIVDRDGLLLRLITELVAGSDNLAALDPRSRHPHGHRPGIMVAPDALL